MTLQVLLDTNIPIILSTGILNLDIELDRLIPQKHQLIFISACMEELEHLKKEGLKISQQVAFAQKLIKKYTLIDYNPKNVKLVDDKILQYAKENHPNCIVVTNDFLLKRKLREKEIPLIFIKSKGHLELIGTLK